MVDLTVRHSPEVGRYTIKSLTPKGRQWLLNSFAVAFEVEGNALVYVDDEAIETFYALARIGHILTKKEG